MIIYLYVKTHNKTGLKYLGQTSSKDPHKYNGSGTYWKLHLKKHGIDYTTEILKECQNKQEVTEWGIYYSNLWDIVNSNEWANLMVEQGDGGRQTEEVRKRIGEAGKGRIPWNKGKKVWSDEERKIISERNRQRPPQSAETIAKRVAKNKGRPRTPDQVAAITAGRIANSGWRHSAETKEKISKANRGKESPKKGIKTGKSSWNSKVYIVTNLCTMEETIIYSLQQWCTDNGFSYSVASRNAKANKEYKNYSIVSKD